MLENLFAPEKAPSEEPHQTGEIGTIIRQIRDLPEYNVQQESRLKQAILGQALRGRSPRSSRRANRSPTAMYWTTTGSVCCCSAAPKGWAGSNTDPGNGSSSGKQLGLFPDRLHEGCSSFDFRGRRPDGGKALPFGAKGVGWCDRLQPAGVFRLQQSARRSAKPCQGGGGALEYGQLAGYRSVFFDKMALSFPLQQAEGLNRVGKPSLPVSVEKMPLRHWNSF